jgi:sugar fermentation stimulation protein A
MRRRVTAGLLGVTVSARYKVPVRFPAPPVEARFVRRYQRFFVDVELEGGATLTAHCPNTGSLSGCLASGAPVWLRDSGDERRKLRHTFQAIRVGDTWVNVDTGLPNRVVGTAVAEGRVAALAGYDTVRPEVRYGTGSRIDLLLERAGAPSCHVEIKNTTLADGSTALFPDAVTSRGLKHLFELVEVVRGGGRAVQLFFVSRADVDVFAPADHVDPAYSAALRDAARAGVEVLAFRARVEPQEVALGEAIGVDLSPRVLPAAAPARARARRS